MCGGGLGFGLFQSPNLKAIMSAAPKSRSGSASGIIAISRLLGQTFVAKLISYEFTHGLRLALWLGSVMSLIGLVVCMFRWHIRSIKTKLNKT